MPWLPLPKTCPEREGAWMLWGWATRWLGQRGWDGCGRSCLQDTHVFPSLIGSLLPPTPRKRFFSFPAWKRKCRKMLLHGAATNGGNKCSDGYWRGTGVSAGSVAQPSCPPPTDCMKWSKNQELRMCGLEFIWLMSQMMLPVCFKYLLP